MKRNQQDCMIEGIWERECRRGKMRISGSSLACGIFTEDRSYFPGELKPRRRGFPTWGMYIDVSDFDVKRTQHLYNVDQNAWRARVSFLLQRKTSQVSTNVEKPQIVTLLVGSELKRWMAQLRGWGWRWETLHGQIGIRGDHGKH